MRRAIEWTDAIRKELRRVDLKTQRRIVSAAERLSESGHGDVRRIQERPGELAMRVGDWRVFFVKVTEHIDGQPTEIYRFLRLRPRGSAYGH